MRLFDESDPKTAEGCRFVIFYEKLRKERVVGGVTVNELIEKAKRKEQRLDKISENKQSFVSVDQISS